MSATSEAEHVLSTLEAIDDALDSGGVIAERFERCVAQLVDGLGGDHLFAWCFVSKERGALLEPMLLSRDEASSIALDALREDEQLGALIERSRASGAPEVAAASSGPLAQAGGTCVVHVVEPELGPAWVVGALASGQPLAARLLARASRRMASAVTRDVMLAHIERANQRVHDLVGASDVAVLIIDLGTQRVVEVNTRAESVLGWPPGQLLGVSLSELNPPQQPDGSASEEALTARLAQVAAGTHELFKWNFRHTDGEYLPCRVEMSLVPDAERLLIHTAITIV